MNNIEKAVTIAEQKIDETAELNRRVDFIIKKKKFAAKKELIASVIDCKKPEPRPNGFIQFFKAMVSDSGVVSSKRFIVLMVALNFLVASYVMLFSPNANANKDIFMQIIEYDFYIIIVGFGFIAGEGLVNILINKFKAAALKEMNKDEADPDEPEDIPAFPNVDPDEAKED